VTLGNPTLTAELKERLAAGITAETVGRGIAELAAWRHSQRTIDISLLPDLVPGHNSCLDRAALTTHACQPVAALLQSIVPAPTTERAVVSAADVLQLCGAHNIRDVVCP
jgi:hypothetical protein